MTGLKSGLSEGASDCALGSLVKHDAEGPGGVGCAVGAPACCTDVSASVAVSLAASITGFSPSGQGMAS